MTTIQENLPSAALSIAPFIESTAFGCRADFLYFAMKQAVLGHVCEFGVYQGTSLRILASHTSRTVYGFDSFQGLPEEWNKTEICTRPVGTFKCQKPVNIPSNGELVEGLFADTIPRWKAEHEENVGFLHVDCDIYQSAYDVLFGMNDRIVPGTVIVFDELYRFDNEPDYSNWAQHEFKAMNEWLVECDRSVEIIGHVKNYSAAGIKVAR